MSWAWLVDDVWFSTFVFCLLLLLMLFSSGLCDCGVRLRARRIKRDFIRSAPVRLSPGSSLRPVDRGAMSKA